MVTEENGCSANLVTRERYYGRCEFDTPSWAFPHFWCNVQASQQKYTVMFQAVGAMAVPPSHSQSVLPNPRILILERIERVDEQFWLFVTVNQLPACPACGHTSHRRVSTTLRHSDMEFSEYRRQSLWVC